MHPLSLSSQVFPPRRPSDPPPLYVFPISEQVLGLMRGLAAAPRPLLPPLGLPASMYADAEGRDVRAERLRSLGFSPRAATEAETAGVDVARCLRCEGSERAASDGGPQSAEAGSGMDPDRPVAVSCGGAAAAWFPNMASACLLLHLGLWLQQREPPGNCQLCSMCCILRVAKAHLVSLSEKAAVMAKSSLEAGILIPVP